MREDLSCHGWGSDVRGDLNHYVVLLSDEGRAQLSWVEGRSQLWGRCLIRLISVVSTSDKERSIR